jgi:hypothetical protein
MTPLAKDSTLSVANLAPFEIWEVMLDNSTIKFFKPLVVKPEILPPEDPGDKNYLTVDVPELNISVHADNREDLWEFVLSDIRFVWQHIVLCQDSTLSQAAIQIKKNCLAIAEVVDG